MTRLAVSLGALTERVDVLKTQRKWQKTRLCSLLPARHSASLHFALFEVQQSLALRPIGHKESVSWWQRSRVLIIVRPAKPGKMEFREGRARSDRSAQNGSRPPLNMPPAFIFTVSMRLEAFWTQIFSHTKFAPSVG